MRHSIWILVLVGFACHREPTPTQAPTQASKVRASNPAADRPTQPLSPQPQYDTMLSTPCAIVDDRTVTCLPKQGRSLKKHVLDDRFEANDRFVHLAHAQDRICALVRPSGTILCWEERERFSDKPPEGTGLMPIEGAIDMAPRHDGMCVLLDGGDVLCWGKNEAAQLGDGSRTDRESPAPVELPAPAIDIEGSYITTCARLANDDVYCWGGNPTPGDPRRARPTRIQGLPPLLELESTWSARIEPGVWMTWNELDHVPERGYTTAKREDDARRYFGLTCWNERAALWCEMGPDDIPEKLMGDVQEFDGRTGAYCIRRTDGSVWCVGHRLGLHTPPPKVEVLQPTQVPGLDEVRDVAMDTDGACAIHGAGKVSCWGAAPTPHAREQNPRFIGTPQQVPLPGPATQVVVAEDGACALVAGHAHCWGSNGQVVDFGAADRVTTRGDSPCGVASDGLHCLENDRRWYADPKQTTIAADRKSALPETFGTRCWSARGKVRCERWTGEYDCYELPPGVECGPTLPLALNPPLSVRPKKGDTIITGGSGACVLSKSGTLRCSRAPEFNGGETPAVIEPQQNIDQASFGQWAICAVHDGGRVRCSGKREDRPGRNTIGTLDIDIDDARSVHIGGSVACAIRADRSLWCWGETYYGQRGQGGESWRESWRPIQLQLLQAKARP